MYQYMAYLSHESRLSAHVGPCDQDTRGITFLLVLFTATSTADVDVIGDEVIAKKGLGDTRVAGPSEVKERRNLVITLREHQLWPGHGSVSTLAVA